MTRHVRQLIAALHPRLAVVGHDLAMVWLAWFAANWIRWNLQPDPPQVPWFAPEIGRASCRERV